MFTFSTKPRNEVNSFCLSAEDGKEMDQMYKSLINRFGDDEVVVIVVVS